MAFTGRDNDGTILNIVGGRGTYTEDITPRDVTASGQISVPEGRLLPLTVQEADGAPINTETRVLVFPNASVVSSGNQAEIVFPTATSGTIVGPSGASTDNALVRWDGTSGTVIQNSNALLTDGGDLTLTGDLGATDVNATNVNTSTLDATGNITGSGDLTITGNATANDVVANRVILPQSQVSATWQAASDEDYFIMASGAGEIVLPASPVIGQTHIVKDVAGTAGSSPVTVAGSGANIDGAATTQLVNNYESIGFIWNGVTWSMF